MSYRERTSPEIPGAAVWTRTDLTATPVRVIPDGCVDLIWAAGRLLVAGPDTRAHLAAAVPGTSYTGLRFAPGTGPAVLGVPAQELRDRRVPLDALWPDREVGLIAQRVAEADAPGRALEAAVRSRGRQPDTYDPLTAAILRGARRAEPVAALAARVGLGERQLHRRSLRAFGYGPKTLVRVLRMNRALELAWAGVPLAEVAAGCGYADQAHLAREVKALTGMVPTGLLG